MRRSSLLLASAACLFVSARQRGADEGIFAESPDRVFIPERGELPKLDRPFDRDGNLYLAEVNNGRPQKFRPRKGANPAFLVGQPVRSAS
jgi:hypothetical protein